MEPETKTLLTAPTGIPIGNKQSVTSFIREIDTVTIRS